MLLKIMKLKIGQTIESSVNFLAENKDKIKYCAVFKNVQ